MPAADLGTEIDSKTPSLWKLLFHDHWHLPVLGSGESDSKRKGWRWKQRLGAPGLGSSQTDIYCDQEEAHHRSELWFLSLQSAVTIAILFMG